MFSGGATNLNSASRAVVVCQVCSEEQTLTDGQSGESSDEAYIMECCFSIVCKTCVGVTSHHHSAPPAGTIDPHNEQTVGEEEP